MADFNPFSLKGKNILVTGASSGIGRETSIECAKMGANVIITARNKDRLTQVFETLCSDIGQNHKMVIADLSSSEGIDSLISEIDSLDGISLNAGIVKTLPIKYIDQNVFQYTLNVNMVGPILLIQKLLKKKKVNKRGSIVFTSSISGVFVSKVGNTMYGVSKSGLSAFMKGLALEIAPKGIRSNSVNPGYVQTGILSEGIITEDDLKKNLESYPMRRFGKPEDVAFAIIYLLSDASSWVTGHTLVVDGGVTLM